MDLNPSSDSEQWHHSTQGVIGLLVDEVNPLVSVMKVDKAQCFEIPQLLCTADEAVESLHLHQAPTESYADIGGLEDQIMEMKEAGSPHGQEDVVKACRNQ